MTVRERPVSSTREDRLPRALLLERLRFVRHRQPAEFIRAFDDPTPLPYRHNLPLHVSDVTLYRATSRRAAPYRAVPCVLRIYFRS